jgi:hypothetical protein
MRVNIHGILKMRLSVAKFNLEKFSTIKWLLKLLKNR